MKWKINRHYWTELTAKNKTYYFNIKKRRETIKKRAFLVLQESNVHVIDAKIKDCKNVDRKS